MDIVTQSRQEASQSFAASVQESPVSQEKRQIETESEHDPLLNELRDIAGSEAYIGTLSQVDIAFSRIPNVQALSRVHNLVSLTLICA